MSNRMIMGRYVDTGSWMHRLDPRSKTIAMLLFMIAIFLVNSFIEIGIVALFAIVIMLSTKVPFRLYLRALRPLLFLMVFIFVFQLLFEASGTQLLNMGPIKLYAGGLEKGTLSVTRMILFVSFTAILTLTTPPLRLTQGLEDIMQPLKWLRISPRKITLMLSISLRFIPTVFEEADKILKAQASRGMDLKDQSLGRKARLLIALLVPVTIGAIRRAGDLVDSMESRGYQLSKPRSRFHILHWKRSDSLLILAVIVLLLIVGLPWMEYAGF
ncbi:MAG: energy-coupling factor transporter transmembrane protein EcfT [Gorillibacterium sp.]|nr:energy-coupling factor transporter transmembrane protein EcfT [Gorillibacterium sp.]